MNLFSTCVTMEDLADISFSVRERFGKDKRPMVVEKRVALQIEAGEYGLSNRYWERSASLHVRAALEKFDSLDEETILYLVAEAERLPDILNLNAGLLAAAQVFYQRSMNQLTVELFQRLAPDILRVVVNNNLMSGSTAVSTLKRQENVKPERYLFDLWRYVCRLGMFRGHFDTLKNMETRHDIL